jgi:hypothetical protein
MFDLILVLVARTTDISIEFKRLSLVSVYFNIAELSPDFKGLHTFSSEKSASASVCWASRSLMPEKS